MVNNIEFTTQQARSIAGVSSEAWRHWRKHIPHIAKKKGKCGRFSLGEIVVLCAVEEIVSTFGLRVAMLSIGLDQIFHSCAPMGILRLRNCSFVITASKGNICKSADLNDFSSSAVVVPCERFVDQVLAATFQNSDEVLQKNLPFPLTSIKTGAP